MILSCNVSVDGGIVSILLPCLLRVGQRYRAIISFAASA